MLPKRVFHPCLQACSARSIVARGLLSGGDAYLVEEHEENDGNLVRRLVFAANTNVIQTEVKLRSRAGGAGARSDLERARGCLTGSATCASPKWLRDSSLLNKATGPGRFSRIFSSHGTQDFGHLVFGAYMVP